MRRLSLFNLVGLVLTDGVVLLTSASTIMALLGADDAEGEGKGEDVGSCELLTCDIMLIGVVAAGVLASVSVEGGVGRVNVGGEIVALLALRILVVVFTVVVVVVVLCCRMSSSVEFEDEIA